MHLPLLRPTRPTRRAASRAARVFAIAAMAAGSAVRADLLAQRDSAGKPATVAAAPAGASVLTGRVRDPAGQPVSYAAVFVDGGTARALADSAGRFRLTAVPPGKPTIGVRRIGYQPLFFEVEMPSDHTVNVDVKLIPVVRTLREVVVEGRRLNLDLMRVGFYDRQKSASGTFFGPEQLQNRPTARLSNIIRDAPGVTIEGTMIQGGIPYGRVPGGYCVMATFVDGVRVDATIGGRGVGIDYLVPVTEISAIEVYPRATTTPHQFQDSRNMCGAVVIWTKVQ